MHTVNNDANIHLRMKATANGLHMANANEKPVNRNQPTTRERVGRKRNAPQAQKNHLECVQSIRPQRRSAPMIAGLKRRL